MVTNPQIKSKLGLLTGLRHICIGAIRRNFVVMFAPIIVSVKLLFNKNNSLLDLIDSRIKN